MFVPVRRRFARRHRITPTKMRILICSEDILPILRMTTGLIKLLDVEGTHATEKITPEVAMALVSYHQFEARATATRIKWLRPLEPIASFAPAEVVDYRQFPLDKHWWDDRACLRWWKDMGSPPGRIVALDGQPA